MARRRRARVTPLGGFWFAIAAVFSFLAVFTEVLLWVIAAVFALIAAVFACIDPEAGRIAARASVPPPRRSGGKPGSAGGKRNSGKQTTRPGTQPKKPSRCGARCRRSTKPVRSCDCSCKGRSHGCEVGRSYAGSRAEATSTALKREEKKHVKENETWRKRN